jgi:hypothetical protein
MHNLKFEEPVSLYVGMGGKLEVRSVMDMHRYLTDFPISRRSSVYSTAVRACEAARQGHLTADQARRCFVQFAKVHDLLWPEVDAVIADRALGARPSHV